MPSTAYIIGVVLFSIIGLAAYYYGKKVQRPVLKWLGVALMLYPYVISETWLLYLVGIGLCVALYVYRGDNPS
jgi:uncharacterized membrane protein YhhN